jgi:hypothetical protein
MPGDLPDADRPFGIVAPQSPFVTKSSTSGAIGDIKALTGAPLRFFTAARER